MRRRTRNDRELVEERNHLLLALLLADLADEQVARVRTLERVVGLGPLGRWVGSLVVVVAAGASCDRSVVLCLERRADTDLKLACDRSKRVASGSKKAQSKESV